MSSMRRRTLRWNFIKCNKFVNSIFVSSRRRFVWIVLKKPSCSYFIHRLISLFSPLSNRSGRSSYVYIMCRVSIFFSLLVFYFQSSSRRKLRTFMRVFSFLLFACLQMDLIIVVVFIVVLYVSCLPIRMQRARETTIFLPSFNPTTFYFSLSPFRVLVFAQSHNELLLFLVVYIITSVVTA